MTIIGMMCDMALLDKVASSVLRECTDVADMVQHLRGHRLRWLGHLQRMNVESLTRKVREKIIMANVRKGLPKKT